MNLTETALEISQEIESVKARNAYIDQYLDGFEFLLIGVLLGVLGGMWGSVIDRQFSQYGAFYTSGLPIVTVIVFFFINRSIRKKVKELSDQNNLALKDMKKKWEDAKKEIVEPGEVSK